MDEHIDEELSLPTLAAIACLSQFHFQRIYQKLVGETPTQTVRRLRLQRAAVQLARGETSALDAATRAGYGSSQAFCRAFRRRYGMTPSRFKRNGARWLAEQMPQRASFELVELPAQIVYGLHHQGVDWDCGWSCCQIIGRASAESLWHPHRTGLLIRYISDPLSDGASVKADICILEDDHRLATIGLERYLVAGGSFALLRLAGSLDRALGHAANLLARRLPEMGMERRAAPVLRRLTRDLALTPPSEWEFELYVPVQRQSATASDRVERADDVANVIFKAVAR